MARRRITQDRVKRFGRSGPQASGQGHGQQQQRREPQLGPDPEAPFRRRHLVPLSRSSSVCCCFLFRVSASFRGQTLLQPAGRHFRLRRPSQFRPGQSDTDASASAQGLRTSREKRRSQPTPVREQSGPLGSSLPFEGHTGTRSSPLAGAHGAVGRAGLGELQPPRARPHPPPFAVHSGDCGLLRSLRAEGSSSANYHSGRRHPFSSNRLGGLRRCSLEGA